MMKRNLPLVITLLVMTSTLVAAEEAKDPARNVPRGIIAARARRMLVGFIGSLGRNRRLAEAPRESRRT